MTIAGADAKRGVTVVVLRGVGETAVGTGTLGKWDRLLDLAALPGRTWHIDCFRKVALAAAESGRAPLFPVLKAMEGRGRLHHLHHWFTEQGFGVVG